MLWAGRSLVVGRGNNENIYFKDNRRIIEEESGATGEFQDGNLARWVPGRQMPLYQW